MIIKRSKPPEESFASPADALLGSLVGAVVASKNADEVKYMMATLLRHLGGMIGFTNKEGDAEHAVTQCLLTLMIQVESAQQAKAGGATYCTPNVVARRHPGGVIEIYGPFMDGKNVKYTEADSLPIDPRAEAEAERIAAAACIRFAKP